MAEAMEANTDNFEAAFQQIAAQDAAGDMNAQPPVEEAVEDETPVEEPETEAETEGVDASGEPATENAKSSEEVVAEPESAPTKESATQATKESDDAILARFAELVNNKAAETAPAKAPAPVEPEEEAEESLFSEEEAKFLEDYEKDWPDVARAETLRRRAEYRELVKYVFDEIAKEIAPLSNALGGVVQQNHLQSLQATITDYNDVRDKVIEWVGTQPEYLQNAYNHVIQYGTVDEVADLVNRYKQATGTAIQSSPAPVKTETELPTAAKKAAKSLAPVSSKRSAVIQGADPNDFSAAFEEFAGKI